MLEKLFVTDKIDMFVKYIVDYISGAIKKPVDDERELFEVRDSVFGIILGHPREENDPAIVNNPWRPVCIDEVVDGNLDPDFVFVDHGMELAVFTGNFNICGEYGCTSIGARIYLRKLLGLVNLAEEIRGDDKKIRIWYADYMLDPNSGILKINTWLNRFIKKPDISCN